MYMCLGIYIFSLSTISLLDFETVMSVMVFLKSTKYLARRIHKKNITLFKFDYDTDNPHTHAHNHTHTHTHTHFSSHHAVLLHTVLQRGGSIRFFK